MPAEERPQLDLFADSRDVMLRNDAINALMRRDLEAAGAARQAWSREDQHHQSLPALETRCLRRAQTGLGQRA